VTTDERPEEADAFASGSRAQHQKSFSEAKSVPPNLSSSSEAKPTRGAIKHIAVLLTIYVLAVFAVNPLGEFTLNDDWVYGKAVRTFLDTGRLTLEGSCSACYLHIILGALVSKIFGFSLQVLHLFSLSWGALAIVSFWTSLRECGASRAISSFITLNFAFSPIFFLLNFSFMTDVPALTLCNFFFLFTLKALKKKSLALLILASIFLDAAICIRQVYLVFALPAAVSPFLITKPLSKRLGLLFTQVLLPCLFAVCITYVSNHESLTHVAINTYQIEFARLRDQLVHAPVLFWSRVFGLTSSMTCYLAYFSIPAIALFMGSAPLRGRFLFARFFTCAVRPATYVFLIGLTALICVEHKLFPFAGNIFWPPFICPLSIVGNYHYSFPVLLTPIVAIAGLLSIKLISSYFSATKRRLRVAKRDGKFFFGTGQAQSDSLFGVGFDSGSAGILPASIARSDLLIAGCFLVSLPAVFAMAIFRDFDRYYLVALPFLFFVFARLSNIWNLAIFKVRWKPTLSSVTACVFLALVMFSSTVAIQDCLEASRARMLALSDLENSGVSPLRIDGGWDYNLWHNSNLQNYWQQVGGRAEYLQSTRGDDLTRNLRWWPVSGEDYVISSNMPSARYPFRVLKAQPYFSWVKMAERKLYVLKREAQ
jgi:hypothetical protein